MAEAGGDVERRVPVLVHAVDLSTWKRSRSFKKGEYAWSVFQREAAQRGRTVLDQGLRAGEASVNRCHVKRTLPIPTLTRELNTQPLVLSLKP